MTLRSKWRQYRRAAGLDPASFRVGYYEALRDTETLRPNTEDAKKRMCDRAMKRYIES